MRRFGQLSSSLRILIIALADASLLLRRLGLFFYISFLFFTLWVVCIIDVSLKIMLL
jgi:hypothetical protein